MAGQAAEMHQVLFTWTPTLLIRTYHLILILLCTCILRFTLPVGVESFSVYLFGTEQVNHSCCYCCGCEHPTPLTCAHHSEVGFL